MRFWSRVWRTALLAIPLLVPLGCARETGIPQAARYIVEAAPGQGIGVEAEFSSPGRRFEVEIRRRKGEEPPVGSITAEDLQGRPLVCRPETGRDAWRWTIENPDRGSVVLRYRIFSNDPLHSADATFLDLTRTVLVGNTVFVTPAEIDGMAAADVLVELRLPADWPAWSTWGTGRVDLAPATYDDLVNGFAVAGDFSERSLSSGNARAVILVEGRGSGRTGLTVANRLLPVLREMVGLFGESPRGGRFEVLAVYRMRPATGNRSTMAGIGKERGFLCLASPDRYRDLRDITALAAHECLHAWLGGALRVPATPPHANAPELIWFVEGLTEYLSWRLLRDAGVIDATTYDEVVATKREKAAEAGRGLRLADAAARVDDIGVYELVYTRGFLVAELIDARMTEACGAGALDDTLRDLFRSTNYYRTGTWLDAGTVRDAFAARCASATTVIREHAERGRDLPPLALFTSRDQ